MDPRLARLPGVLPLTPPDDWLRVDEAYAPQMALRRRLIASRRDVVQAMLPMAQDAADELLGVTLAHVPRLGFAVGDTSVRCPDGVEVALDRSDPLGTLGRLVQPDLCLMMQQGDEHVLAGAILCFPASWSLREKLGRPLTGVHRPVAVYDADQARRVQRLFDAIRPEQPLWRANALAYVDASLHQPRTEANRREKPIGPARYVRSERQVLMRLPQTRAVAFVIHTSVVERSTLSPAEDAGLHPV